ncbi:Nucleotidyltransferase domain protein [mine drainage metagenome]|uniref:Nucleotidyltransferase domain protein n=1 Tax=mine drainage metagenome TaxID=410659 RepID=T1A1L8_9ZZZZ
MHLAREFQATSVRVFGSVARGEATARSDVDLLVKFRRPIGLLGRIEFKERAEKILGHPVDLATEGNLHWLTRPQILAEAVDL